MLAETSKPVAIGRIWLAGGDGDLLRRVGATEPPRFPLRGRDLKAAGVPSGPALGGMLRAMRDWWLEGGCVADAEACRSELARRLAGEAN
jgi:poly(A) polymerase/tRNA nucleotidyltransferase (CCA-adding enzyme)